MAIGFGSKGRVPQQDTRARRALGNLHIQLDEPSGLSLSFSGIKAKVQDVLSIDDDGILVSYSSGLYNESGVLKVDHDATVNFVANEHINHTTVSVTAGTGLTGGGTIAETRTISCSIPGLDEDTTPDIDADYLMTYDTSGTAHKKVLLNKVGGGGGSGDMTKAVYDVNENDRIDMAEGLILTDVGSLPSPAVEGQIVYLASDDHIYFGIDVTIESYYDTVMADTPYAYWKLDESTAAAAVADSSGNGYTAANGSSITDQDCAIAGLVPTDPGNATQGDSALNDVIILPTLTGLNTILSNGPVTFEGWIKASTAGSYKYVWYFVNNSGTNPVINMCMNPGGTQGAIRFQIGNKLFPSADIGFNNNAAHHFVAILNGSAMTATFYLDNVEKTLTPSGNFGQSWANALDTNFLMGSSGANPTACVLDEFAIYDYALTTDQIAAHYNAGVG